MLDTLTKSELNAAEKLIKSGIATAKLSIQRLVQSPMQVISTEFGFTIENISPLLEAHGNGHLIKAELIGQVEGFAYLILSENDVNITYSKCLPEAVLATTSDANQSMKEGLLSEFGNMMISGVITEFVDMLDMEMYSHVPTTHQMSISAIRTMIISEAQQFGTSFNFKADFKGKNIELAPRLIFALNEQFVDKVKENLV